MRLHRKITSNQNRRHLFYVCFWFDSLAGCMMCNASSQESYLASLTKVYFRIFYIIDISLVKPEQRESSYKRLGYLCHF